VIDVTMEIFLLFNLIRCEISFVYFKASFSFVDYNFDGNYLSFKLISSALRSVTCMLLMLRCKQNSHTEIEAACVQIFYFLRKLHDLGQIWCDDEIRVGRTFVGNIYRIILMKFWMMRVNPSELKEF